MSFVSEITPGSLAVAIGARFTLPISYTTWTTRSLTKRPFVCTSSQTLGTGNCEQKG